jgi:hypothetical protein
LAAVLLLALRLVVEAGFVAAELLVLRCLDAEEAFFLEAPLFSLRGFSLPVTVSTNAVTALDAISFAAAMFILAASVNASGTDVISPSFSLSIFTSLPASGKRYTDLRCAVQKEKLCGVEVLTMVCGCPTSILVPSVRPRLTL